MGIRAGGMDRMVPRRPLGRPVSPQTLPEKKLSAIRAPPGPGPLGPGAHGGPVGALGFVGCAFRAGLYWQYYGIQGRGAPLQVVADPRRLQK